MSLNFAIPRIESPIMGNGGVMSRDWYLFFCAVVQTIGGPAVTSGGGIAPIEVQQQFEEYAVTSIEAAEALRGLAELRNEADRGESPKIHELLVMVDELRNELSVARSENNQFRNRIESIEGRLG